MSVLAMICQYRVALGVLCLAAVALAAEPGVKAEYVGGTVPGIARNVSARLDLTGTDALHFRAGSAALNITYIKINTLEYGQTVSRRYAAAVLISPVLLLSKSRKHFVTIGYVDDGGNQQALVFRVNKGDIRTVLAGLEARTGRRVEYQDNEARKGGKG
jgi:hypothetical protein